MRHKLSENAPPNRNRRLEFSEDRYFFAGRVRFQWARGRGTYSGCENLPTRGTINENRADVRQCGTVQQTRAFGHARAKRRKVRLRVDLDRRARRYPAGLQIALPLL